VIAFFVACAALGGVVLVIQLLLGLLGGDSDAGHAVHHGGGVGEGLDLVSVRSISAGVAFFGLAGAGTATSGWPLPLALGVAISSGLLATVVVAYLLRAVRGLEEDNSEQIENALGQTATVYLRIPANRAGAGKIHVAVQGRTVEYQAVTPGGELPSGAMVVVRDIVGPDVVEVVPQSAGELIDGLV
jgi:membrane protein implicated in regulation of membrane protease activity